MPAYPLLNHVKTEHFLYSAALQVCPLLASLGTKGVSLIGYDECALLCSGISILGYKHCQKLER